MVLNAYLKKLQVLKREAAKAPIALCPFIFLGISNYFLPQEKMDRLIIAALCLLDSLEYRNLVFHQSIKHN